MCEFWVNLGICLPDAQSVECTRRLFAGQKYLMLCTHKSFCGVSVLRDCKWPPGLVAEWTFYVLLGL